MSSIRLRFACGSLAVLLRLLFSKAWEVRLKQRQVGRMKSSSSGKAWPLVGFRVSFRASHSSLATNECRAVLARLVVLAHGPGERNHHALLHCSLGRQIETGDGLAVSRKLLRARSACAIPPFWSGPSAKRLLENFSIGRPLKLRDLFIEPGRCVQFPRESQERIQRDQTCGCCRPIKLEQCEQQEVGQAHTRESSFTAHLRRFWRMHIA